MWRPSVLRRFAVDQRGVVAVIMAFTLPVLIGFVGLGFDVGFWYFSKQNMQGAADAAAVSAAAALSAGDNAGYTTEARAVAAQRGLIHGQNGVTVMPTFPYSDGTTACPTGNDYC
ncbi:MAG: pilus assembly protein, partial [Alphaproteobacteria bacterium]|nr:pilus assembly protein [Alphaproteobacteria bacterium]